MSSTLIETRVIPEVDLTSPVLVTQTMALDLLDRAVREKGEDHTATCVYAEEGEPVCIVGTVLHYLGIPAADMEGWGTVISSLTPRLSAYGVRFSAAAVCVLSEAQDAQDRGGSWGRATRYVRSRFIAE